MRIIITVCLEQDVAKKLEKQKNKSKLINDLLKKHLFTPKKSIEEQLKEIQDAN